MLFFEAYMLCCQWGNFMKEGTHWVEKSALMNTVDEIILISSRVDQKASQKVILVWVEWLQSRVYNCYLCQMVSVVSYHWSKVVWHSGHNSVLICNFFVQLNNAQTWARFPGNCWCCDEFKLSWQGAVVSAR